MWNRSWKETSSTTTIRGDLVRHASISDVLDVCLHFASNSGCVVKVQGTGINMYVVFRKRMRGTTHAGGGLVRHSESVQHDPGVVSSHTGKSLHIAKATRSFASDLFVFSCQFCEGLPLSVSRVLECAQNVFACCPFVVCPSSS